MQALVSLVSPKAFKNAVTAGMGVAIFSSLIAFINCRESSLGSTPDKRRSTERPLHLL